MSAERARPRGFWTGRVLIVISVPILIASTWLSTIVVWSRTHQDIEPPAGSVYPLGPSHERSFQRNGGTTTVDVAELNLDQGGRTRRALVSRPTDPVPGAKLPVIFYLHGLGGTAESMFDEGGNGFVPALVPSIAVFPEGEWSSWNAGACCRPATTMGMDDVAYLHALVTDMKRRPEVDPDRIYLFGFSNGGMMVYRYLCDHADELAGAMSVGGTNVSGCEPNAPLPILHMHGTKDEVVRYEGGVTPLELLVGTPFVPSTRDAITRVARSMGCRGDQVPGPSSQGSAHWVTSIDWTDCPAGARVRFVTYGEMTHWWPVGAPWSTYDDALGFFGLLPGV